MARAPDSVVVAGEREDKTPVEVLREYMEMELPLLFATYPDAPSGEIIMPYG